MGLGIRGLCHLIIPRVACASFCFPIHLIEPSRQRRTWEVELGPNLLPGHPDAPSVRRAGRRVARRWSRWRSMTLCLGSGQRSDVKGPMP